MTRGFIRRLLTVTVMCGVLGVVLAAPAAAHGRGSDATNYHSTVTATTGPPAVEWRVLNADEYLQVTNPTDTDLIVLDYAGNPYLRIGPDGVFQNRNSQATYVNADRFGETAVPDDIVVDGPPDWEHLSDVPTHAWHDHRIHWMAQALPPGVRTAPDREQVVLDWSVPFRLAGTDHEVSGELVWVPPPSPWPWLVGALIVVALPVAYGLVATRPEVWTGADGDLRRWPGLATPAGVTLLAVSLANVIHLIDDLFATPVGWVEILVAVLQTFFFIAIGCLGATRAIKGGDGAFTALGVGAGAIFLGQGLLYLPVLSSSQAGGLFPGWLSRAVIAVSVAQIVPLGIAAVTGTRAVLPAADDLDPVVEQSP